MNRAATESDEYAEDLELGLRNEDKLFSEKINAYNVMISKKYRHSKSYDSNLAYWLHVCCSPNSHDKVKRWINLGLFNVNEYDVDGGNPSFHKLTIIQPRESFMCFIKLLLRHGLNINLAKSGGYRILNWFERCITRYINGKKLCNDGRYTTQRSIDFYNWLRITQTELIVLGAK